MTRKPTANELQEADHRAALAAICAHDATGPLVSQVQLADALVWLKGEILKAVAPYHIQKEYLSKSALARAFRVSLHTVDKILNTHRITYQRKPSGKCVYSAKDFELAYKANNN